MLMTKERRPAIRTLRDWAISVLNEAGAIRECEEHGWAGLRNGALPKADRRQRQREAALVTRQNSRIANAPPS